MFSQDFKEFIQFLNDHDVHYLVVGGYAVAVHGYPRYTKDIDIWIESSQENATKLMAALDQFGFGFVGLKAEDFLEPNQIIQLGYPPNRIDLLTSLVGVDFQSCYDAKIAVTVGSLVVNFIDIDNLKRNKKASGRLQDLADVENLGGD
jgi:hypothetical protein